MVRYKTFKQLNSVEDLELSFYEEISEIPENEGDLATTVSYVRDKRDGKLYIKKELLNTDKAVYQELLRYEEINEKKLPGVPKLLTITDDGNKLYTIEEFINCPTLHSVMESQAVTAEELVAIFREVCIILESLHKGKNPISHGDVSPRNILVNMEALRGNTKEQKVYLVDFNRAERNLFKVDISEDIKRTCQTLRGCMDTMILKSITEYDGVLWEGLKDIAENGLVNYNTDRQMITDLGRLINKRAPRTEKKKNKYTLPGFRTKKVWKGIIASVVYFLMIIITLFMDFDYEGIMGLYARACSFGMMFSYISWFTNYLGVRDKYSWMTGKNIAKKLIGHIIAGIAIFGFWMMMIILPDLMNIL